MPVVSYDNRENHSSGQGIILIWKNKAEVDASRYEIFRRASLLFAKYDGLSDLGVGLGSPNNFFSKNKTSEPLLYENDKVRIIRTKLYERKDFTFPVEG